MSSRRAWLWLVLFALVAAQTLGLMHRVVHADRGGNVAALAAQFQQDQGPAAGESWVAGLFSSHDDPGCRLFDQLGQGAMIPELPALNLPVLAPAFVLLWFQGEYLARWAALFDARGPPSVR
jgi:hypothetical protein